MKPVAPVSAISGLLLVPVGLTTLHPQPVWPAILAIRHGVRATRVAAPDSRPGYHAMNKSTDIATNCRPSCGVDLFGSAPLALDNTSI